MKKTLLFLLISISIFAHEGGHYGQHDVLRIWHLKTGETVSGNFSSATATDLILEQFQGVKVRVPIAELSIADQKFAALKIKRSFRINGDIEVEKPASYLPYFYLLMVCFFTLLFIEKLRVGLVFRRLAYSSFVLAFIALACKTATEVTPVTPSTPITTIPKTTVSFLDSAFAPFKPALSTASDATYFYVNSNGIPNHNMMIGITAWQQQVPIPQPYTGTNHWSIPLQPVYATTPLSTTNNFMKGAVALAVNGVPIFNALNNRGEDSFAIGELDQWGGHCGRGDDYHYHAAPLHLSTISGLKAIAFALDGFAVYGAKEPDGTTMQTLDTNHGHEWKGNYHYHGTTNYPYVIGAMRGKVSLDPTTPAPENQILPQAFSSSVRPALTPLTGATITDFSAPTSSSYNLTYKIGTKTGTVNYSWNTSGLFTFNFTDVNGTQTTSTYQRK
ncbi:MAG: YHYH protein [Cytophagales bacterium]|nr:YHYH protein [Cytophagales bacterium]